ncbi:c-type cytochrome [Paenibacillus piri]|uniref:C-type cytochrome n=1 Tax=Paenibacillus piri TaxID=2547395 RepID=A0A4V2ZSC8_9BACL|nr:cytochrome c [Paenibacillus piri]TDF92774.1 c-type cytochrome [Paenibacillus piri]
MVKQWLLVLTGCIIIAGMTGCGGSPGDAGGNAGGKKQAAARTQNDGSDPDVIYKSSCIACHGANLEGKAGPSLTKIGAKLGKEQIAAKIQKGGGGMPSYKDKLKDEEIQLLSDWLSAKK